MCASHRPHCRFRRRASCAASSRRSCFAQIAVCRPASLSAGAPEFFGLSSSTVSRRFIEASAAKLKEFRERRLDGHDVVAVLMDGKVFAGETIVTAVGITLQGEKIVLGFNQTTTENQIACRELLRELVDRGLSAENGGRSGEVTRPPHLPFTSSTFFRSRIECGVTSTNSSSQCPRPRVPLRSVRGEDASTVVAAREPFPIDVRYPRGLLNDLDKSTPLARP
jgi:hypothetical protein